MTGHRSGSILGVMKLRETPRIEPREHGPFQSSTDAEGVIDLASSGNPCTPPDRVKRALQEVDPGATPDPRATRAREVIAARLGTTADRILLGNGGTELLWTCGRALAAPGSAVLTVMPGSSELAAAARESGARIVQWRAVERTGFAIDLEQVSELARLEQPALVSLAAPSWPSGAPVPFEALQRMAAALPDVGFVIDQSELELSEQSGELETAPPPNVVLIRSIGKTLALPGVRVGYLWARPELCAFLAARRPSLGTNAFAHAAALAWPDEREHIARCRSELLADRERLTELLRDLGLAPTPSVTGGVLVRVTRAREVAEELRAQHRIAVRDCTDCGLPDHLRISRAPSPLLPLLREALAAVLERRGIPGGREA